MSTVDLPDHLVSLLKTSKYVHLATASKDCIPNVSLMNYTYVPPHRAFQEESSNSHYVIFATSKSTQKYKNIIANPASSLLIHDWVTAKKLSLRKNSVSSTPTADNENSEEQPSRLLNLLQELNQSELSQMSATLSGTASVIEPSSEESEYYEKQLLAANPDANCYIKGDDTVIIKVKILNAKVSDSENRTSFYD